MEDKIKLPPLSQQERDFCQLYVFGEAKFAGKRANCYREIFGDANKVTYRAKQLCDEPNVAKYIKRLLDELRCEDETAAVKLQVSETLKSIMDETSTVGFTDKFGMDLSPAPLRAVAVNAAKALMEIYPICHGNDPKLREERGEGRIVFNVIVPQIISPQNEDKDEQG